MHCIDLTSKRSKLVSYVAKLQNDQIIVHWIDLTSKRFKTWVTSQNYKSDQTTKVIKAQCIASIWRLNDQNFWVTSQNYKRSNYSALHRFDVKTINNVEIRRKTFKTTQNYESDQIIVHCIDFTSKQSKMLRYVAKHSKQLKTTKVIKL